MKEELLFIIPIYSMDEETFDKKWDDFFTQKGYKEKENFADIRACYRNKIIWKYNQVIAYIEVYKHNGDVNFVTYRAQQNVYRYDCPNHYYSFYQSLGNHFYVSKKMTNEDIIEETRRWLNNIAKEHAKNAYADLSLFDNQTKYINLREIFNED